METKLKFFVASWTSTFLDFRGIYIFFLYLQNAVRCLTYLHIVLNNPK